MATIWVSTLKQVNEWEEKTTIKAKDCVVVLYIDGGRPEDKGLTTVDISKRIWQDIEKYKGRPVPKWVRNRVKWRMAYLKKHGIVRVVDKVECTHRACNLWRLTDSSVNYAEYLYENRKDELIIEI